MPVVAVITADELFDVAIEEGRTFIGTIQQQTGPSNALAGLREIFNFLVDQRNKEKEAAREEIRKAATFQ